MKNFWCSELNGDLQKRYACVLEPVNMTLFRKRVFAHVNKLKIMRRDYFGLNGWP